MPDQTTPDKAPSDKPAESSKGWMPDITIPDWAKKAARSAGDIIDGAGGLATTAGHTVKQATGMELSDAGQTQQDLIKAAGDAQQTALNASGHLSPLQEAVGMTPAVREDGQKLGAISRQFQHSDGTPDISALNDAKRKALAACRGGEDFLDVGADGVQLTHIVETHNNPLHSTAIFTSIANPGKSTTTEIPEQRVQACNQVVTPIYTPKAPAAAGLAK